jgi:hypothetical protein
MPNQRNPNKKKIGVWVTDEEHQAIRGKLEQLGYKSLADYLRDLTQPAPKIVDPHQRNPSK